MTTFLLFFILSPFPVFFSKSLILDNPETFSLFYFSFGPNHFWEPLVSHFHLLFVVLQSWIGFISMIVSLWKLISVEESSCWDIFHVLSRMLNHLFFRMKSLLKTFLICESFLHFHEKQRNTGDCQGSSSGVTGY